MTDKTLEVIRKFRTDVNRRGAKAFFKGSCYDFAHMMWRNTPESEIYFLKNRRHYVLKKGKKYYDINGIVKITDKDILEKDNPRETNRRKSFKVKKWTKKKQKKR